MTLKVLLLQARKPDDPMREEERRSFAAKAGLDVDQIVSHDLLQGPVSLRQVKRHDALMVGGSGDFYVSNGSLPHLESHLALLAEVVEIGHPTFASCFGFHILVKALGGRVIHDPETTEVGTYDLTLTEEGRRDPLLGQLPDSFAAQMGRKDRAELLPFGVPNLASSERNPHQAFRIPGKPVWTTQFHPELDRETNLQRYERYLEGYSRYMTAEERRSALERFRDSPHTARLLPAFLELVFDYRP